MKKKIFLSASIFLVFILVIGVYRFCYSYTIVSLPGVFGQNTYEGGTKHEFLKTIINPFKEKELHDKISAYVSSQLSDESLSLANSHFYWWWYERLERIPNFRIVSINEDGEKSTILVECLHSSDYRCVILMDENKENIIDVFF